MRDDDIETRIFAIIADQARMEPEKLSREMTLGELGLASLDVVEIVFAIEESFDIEIPFNANDAELNSDQSVGDVIASVGALIGGD